MPNWCSNSLHFQGNPQRIAEVAEQILIKTDELREMARRTLVVLG